MGVTGKTKSLHAVSKSAKPPIRNSTPNFSTQTHCALEESNNIILRELKHACLTNCLHLCTSNSR